MKQKRYTDHQIVTILREAETGEQTIEVLCRKHGIGQATLYRWRQRFGGMEPK